MDAPKEIDRKIKMEKETVPGLEGIERDPKGAGAYLDLLPSTVLDPLLCGLPILVKEEKTRLSTTLDELIWLCDEGGGIDPLRNLSVGSDGICVRIPSDLSNFRGRIDESRGDGGVFGDGGHARASRRARALRHIRG